MFLYLLANMLDCFLHGRVVKNWILQDLLGSFQGKHAFSMHELKSCRKLGVEYLTGLLGDGFD